MDAELAPGSYEYTITAVLLPHSGAEHEGRLRSMFDTLKSRIAAVSEKYEKGGKSATYGQPVRDSHEIKELRNLKGEQTVIPVSESPGILLQTIPSRPAHVAVQ